MAMITNVTRMVSTSSSLWSPSFIGDIQILEVILAISVFVIIHSIRQRSNLGLPVWPVVGMLPSLVVGLRSNMYEWLTDVLCRTKGTFHFKGPWLSNLNCVVIANPLTMEYMLKTKFSNFPKGDYFRATLEDLLGEGIFNADHEVWRRQRTTASLVFHSAKFRHLTAESLFHLVHRRLVPVLQQVELPAGRTPEQNKFVIAVDLQDILLRLTFDNVCMIALGVDPGCLQPGLPDIPFAQAFERATELSALRFVIPTCIWQAMRHLNIGPEKELKDSIETVNQFANQVIRTRKEELISSSKIHDNSIIPERSDLLSVFMRLKHFSERLLRDICVNFILAGRDTSSVALCWFFWLIDKHPDVEQKILAEIRRIIGERKRDGEIKKGDDRESGCDDVVFKPDEIKKMEYLHAAISEALRLYPSVPVDHKEVVEDDVLSDGTLLKKGTKVIYSIYSMGRMEELWGKDCREYKPERWLRDGNNKFISESAYKFTAFNGGPRLCLGKDFAYYQMKFVAASIIYRYHFKVVENHPVEPKLALTMYMKYGLKVHVIKRDEAEVQKYFKARS